MDQIYPNPKARRDMLRNLVKAWQGVKDPVAWSMGTVKSEETVCFF